MWRSLLANWICYFAAKKPRPLCETGTKRELEKQGKCGHRLIMHSITRWGEIWGGGEWSEETVGGEGVGGSFVPTYIWAGWNGMTIHILFNSIKKGTFTYSDSNPRDSRNQEMWHWCSQIASDYMKFSFNPLRLVSAPPPPLTSSAPCSQTPSLIVTLVNLAHGIQGCPKIISLDKNHWHSNFWRSFSVSFFLYRSTPVHFSQHPLPKNATPFFHQSLIRESFSRFLSSLQFFTLS